MEALSKDLVEYKDKESDIGKWLLMTFGLHFVSSDSIEDIFFQ
jgi:hypothetical protein